MIMLPRHGTHYCFLSLLLALSTLLFCVSEDEPLRHNLRPFAPNTMGMPLRRGAFTAAKLQLYHIPASSAGKWLETLAWRENIGNV